MTNCCECKHVIINGEPELKQTFGCEIWDKTLIEQYKESGKTTVSVPQPCPYYEAKP